jgi:hypothetical protein
MGAPKSVHAKCDRIVVWLAAKEAPAQDEWQAYTKSVYELGSTLPGKQVQVLVVTDGGGPSSVQRTDFVAAMGDVKVRTAVLSSSTLVRGIVTVFNWFNIQNKVFSPKDALGALEFVGVSEVGRTSVWATVEALAKQLGRVETVDSARAYLKQANREDLRAR